MNEQTPTGRTPETPEQWARRVLAEHGPPPQHLHDLVAGLLRRDERTSA